MVYDLTGLVMQAEACVPTPPAGPSFEVCGDARSTQRLLCSSPCEAGDVLVDLRPTETGLEVHCRGNSGPGVYSYAYDGRCEARRLEGRTRFSTEQVSATKKSMAFSPYVFVATGAHGEVWWGANLETAQTLMLDEPPLGQRDGTWPGRAVTGVVEPRLGLVARPHALRSALVEGSELDVLRSGSVTRALPDGGVERVASLGRALTDDDEVRAASSADGGLLVVSVDDQVFIGARQDWLPRLPAALTPARACRCAHWRWMATTSG